MYKVGQGIDVHAFAPNRKLILGGVQIDSELGLIGHSDADVLCHAIMDALLGAIGEDDIGAHFPDSDPRYKDANSLKLLKEVLHLVKARGYKVLNCDSSLLIEAPKIAPYRVPIRENLSEALEVALSDCTVKATTMERLGFIGKREGVVAASIVLLQKEL